ncbi:YMGG-like glycine zipper-containing protein [Hymenobacter sp. ASUV-10]|uniref:YMGG-like glycine zipper-containing protein n=1 Tax=Hymenobacter aranciens TaxID=3063996 RepID=A0ABT9BGC2_9BACT|nr:YMGG-like glycine zipper-containing protein [Hymenobacter sp. ASUV-10]MDO7875563.1 YMGG-like glycine zipper-containing protein [Hymenobacter sp. ASUV-10]
MKVLKFFLLTIMAFFMLVGSAQAQEKKGWSRKAKGAAIGAGAGAATGAVVGGGKGALIGAAAGTVAGGAIGRKKDKKKDPVRYEQYRKK